MGDKEKTYEMMWDCEYCATKKLLGKTHRHCPECGAVQNPEKRYFPPDNEKIAVEDHRFVGADRHCEACKAPNSAAAKHCTECGAPMNGGAEVKAVVDAQKAAPSPAGGTAATSKKSRLPWIIGGVVMVIIAIVMVLVFWKKEATLKVTGHTWERVILIERFMPLSQDAWCDAMPSDAYNVSRFRDVRSYNQIPDGETCTTRRVDNRDGTFSERQECQTKYRKEPVYDDKCRFTVNRWNENRPVKAEGRSLADAPAWPAVNLPASVAAVLGAERMGRRTEKYTVYFGGKSGENHTCDFTEPVWRGMGDNSVWKGKVGVVTNVLDCASMIPSK